MDMEAAWDLSDAVDAHQAQVVAQGRDSGAREGRAKAEAEARALGRTKGAELGLEFGFYVGAVAQLLLWRDAGPAPQASAGETRRQRELRQIRERLGRDGVSKVLDALKPMLDSFPRGAAFDDDVHGRFLKIRAKFKVLEARLGLVLEMQPAAEDAAAAQAAAALAF